MKKLDQTTSPSTSLGYSSFAKEENRKSALVKHCLLPFLFLLLALCTEVQAQQTFRVMSYNVENLFDVQDNPHTNDDEYLPSGSRRWTPKRYRHKLQQIAKVITAAGEWDSPALIGLCEVENDSVLINLLNRTPLQQQDYRYCVGTTSDSRGIRVALFYQRDKFAYIGHSSNPLRHFSKQTRKTRDILHVWGRVISGDTLDVFVCHFPSRYGGEKESEVFRIDAANTVKQLCDSLQQIRQTPFFIVMGDFNDTPTDKSLQNVPPFLNNLFANPKQFLYPGSHKYQGEWSQLDHILVSDKLLESNSPVQVKPNSAQLFAPDFLLTKDKTWRGKRPKRTYYGFRYEAGFSDHLPLLVDLVIRY